MSEVSITMASPPRRARRTLPIWWHRAGNTVAGVTIVLFLLVCLTPFLPAGGFWPLALLGYLFPVLVLLVLVVLIVLALRRSRWFWIPLVTLLLGWQQISSMMGFHFFAREFSVKKPADNLRVMLWNVSAWDQGPRAPVEFGSFRNLMMDVVDQQDADVLCLQEFFEPCNSKKFSSNIAALEAKGYRYHHFYPKSITYSGKRKVGLIILSRYPIIDSATVPFANTPHSEGLISADIKFNDQVIRVFSTHLESSRTDGRGADNALSKTRNALARLKQAFNYRAPQAELVRLKIKESPFPVIVCGNLGDLPNSYTYFEVRDNMQDAFLEHGAGFGATFRFWSPTVRVDYIFAGNDFAVNQFSKPEITYSDHFPLITDVQLKER